MTDAPRLVGSAGDCNLVAWDGKVWRVPMALGPTEIDDPGQRARPGIAAFESVEAAAAYQPVVPPPTPAQPQLSGVWKQSWWDWTGKYTEFVDGISSPIYRRLGTGEERSTRELPPGALYLAREGSRINLGADGQGVYCVLPDGCHWYIDGRANNCTMPNDNEHRCWVRHGGFGQIVTVDKNGKTCEAGGGSIATPKFHGFLTNGELRSC